MQTAGDFRAQRAESLERRLQRRLLGVPGMPMVLYAMDLPVGKRLGMERRLESNRRQRGPEMLPMARGLAGQIAMRRPRRVVPRSPLKLPRLGGGAWRQLMQGGMRSQEDRAIYSGYPMRRGLERITVIILPKHSVFGTQL
jgi:hypothetical protein